MKEALGEQSEWQLKLLTGDDSIYERESILKPIRENVWKKVILISTQIVEAGVDIDMDIGYKDISKLDSEEQFLGRIARSGIKNGIPGIVYFFNFDQAEKIYRDDYRMEKSLTLGNEEMRTVLKEKRFQTYYEQVMHYLKEMKNRKTSEEGLEYFFSESLKKTGLSQNTKANGTDRGRLLACRYYFVPETGDGRWNGKRWQENLGAL